jgi:hypothetical protein
MKDYDAWKTAGPPEADEEQMRAECTMVGYDGVECVFDGWVTAQVTNETTTWTCPKCDAEHEDSTRDRFDNE